MNSNKALRVMLLVLFLGCSDRRTSFESSDDGHRTQDSAQKLLQAEAYYQEYQYDSALRLYKYLLEKDSVEGLFFFRAGYCLGILGNHLEAIEHFRKCIALNYRVFDCYKNIGDLYAIGLKNKQMATEAWNECLRLEPGSEEVRRLLETVNPEL